jgi:hypothetical protein
MMNWKGMEGSGHGLILRDYDGIRLEGLRKTKNNLSQEVPQGKQRINITNINFIMLFKE